MLTIILAIKNRGEFTKRWLAYANEQHCPFKVLIADGGDDVGLEELLKTKGAFPNVSYQYIRYPFDAIYHDYYKKLADCASLVKTPYCMIADDDDFLIYNTIKKSIEFLENNLDYTSCGGQTTYFKFKQQIAKLYGKDIIFTEYHHQVSVDSNSSIKRLVSQFENYHENYYHVYRTEILREHLEIQAELNLDDLWLGEILLAYLSVIAGKTKFFDDIYLLKQLQYSDSSSCREVAEKGDSFDKMLLDTWSEDISKFIEILSKRLSQKDNIKYNDAKKFLKNGYKAYKSKMMCYDLIIGMAQRDRSLFGRISRSLFTPYLEERFSRKKVKSNKDDEIMKIKSFLTQSQERQSNK